MTEEETSGTSMVSMSQSQFLMESNKQLSEVMARFKKPVRLIFEASTPTTQCFNTVGPCLPRNMGEPEEQGCKCWICGLPIYLLNDGTEYLNTQSKNKIKGYPVPLKRLNRGIPYSVSAFIFRLIKLFFAKLIISLSLNVDASSILQGPHHVA